MAPESRGLMQLPGYVTPIDTAHSSGSIVRKPQFEKFFAYSHLYETLAASAVGTRRTFTVDPNVSHFAVKKTAALADNYAAKVQLLITPAQESFADTPFYVAHFGTGQYPLILNPPWRIGKNATVTCVADARQLVAAAQNVRIAYHGAKVYPTPVYPLRVYDSSKPATYVANYTDDDGGVGDLAANQVLPTSIRVDADSDFEVQKVTFVSDAGITVQIRSDGENWFDQDLRSELLGGSVIENAAPPMLLSGWAPFILPAPRLITGGGYIITTVSEKGGVANRAQILFHGTRYYPAGGR